MTRHPLLLTARDLLIAGLAYVVLCKLTNDPPTYAGFAVVVACSALYRSYRRQEAPVAPPVASNVVPFRGA